MVLREPKEVFFDWVLWKQILKQSCIRFIGDVVERYTYKEVRKLGLDRQCGCN